MFSLVYTKRFKREFKYYQNNSKLLVELGKVLDILMLGKTLPEKYCNHKLIGEFKSCCECHIEPDVLLIYKIDKKEISILLLRIGSHSDLF